MKLALIAMSGLRTFNPELARLGMTLPGFVERGKAVAALPSLSLLTLAGMTPDRFDVSYPLDDGPALGLLFLAIYLGFVVASVWLQSRVFLVFGALGCYAYVSKLAFDVFAGSLGFVFGLALVGLLIVLSAVGYQRYVQPWLTRQLAPAAGARSVGT